jgi:hypothetical protein
LPSKATGLEVLFLALATLGLFVAPRANAAQGAYEPNDSVLAAAGPLLFGGAYTAALEMQGDRDLFAFHMTAPAPTQAQIAVTNLGGGDASDLSVTILDSAATPLAGQSYVRAGETRIVGAQLGPQKYYVEVATGAGFGDSYRLVPGGSIGAFASYSQIAGRCAVARTALATAETRLNHSEARRQRAIAYVRRARYAGPAARRKARVAFRKARRRLRSDRGAAREAARRLELWCSIAA